MSSVAIIGSGPTAIYTLLNLISAPRPIDITLFEAQSEAGTGSPYRPALNDKAMLSNIASLEIPAISETLVEWLVRQPDSELMRMDVLRGRIDERAFFPRLVLGEFFRSQFLALLREGRRRGHGIEVKTNTRVVDIVLQERDIRLEVRSPDDDGTHYAFDHVVMATGHSWPDETQAKPGYFTSPWPASALHAIGNVAVGIRGTSLSAIDALVAVASAHGAFLMDQAAALQYHPHAGADDFHVTLMSRKGLLPEADFYHPVPYLPLAICTAEAVEALKSSGRQDLLDAVFELFRRELAACDPAYADRIDLPALTVETFADAYFAERDENDPFIWAARNLAEASANQRAKVTVPWRYAILRMHEVVALVVPSFAADDLRRFHKHFKTVFADDYATVPHTSIERILAMRRAGKLDILKLGNAYEIDVERSEPGAVLRYAGQVLAFPAFIEAIGQDSLSAPDLPFPSLLSKGGVGVATTAAQPDIAIADAEVADVETAGIALDPTFRLIVKPNLCNNLYCLSLPFLLHQFPFVQGITSSSDLANIVGAAIRARIGSTFQFEFPEPGEIIERLIVA